MKNWLIKKLGGYTSAEYDWYKAEAENLRVELASANQQIEKLKQTAKVRFTIKIDGGKVWVE